MAEGVLAIADLHVVIIGSGIGGLVAAVELASCGVRVTVLEKEARVGGKLRAVDVAGRSIDAGPTVLTLPGVLKGVFEAAGDTLSDHLTLTPQSVLARHAWPDGSRLDLFADPERSAEAIGSFAGAAAARGFRAFRAEAAVVYAALEDTYIRAARPGNPLDLMARAGPGGWAKLMRIQPFTTLWAALGSHFRDPRLRQLFGRYATYCGSSPFEAPATLMLIAAVEQQGVWTVRGGMAAIGHALAGLCVRKGAILRTDAAVTGITLGRDGSACGVVLADGEPIVADAVLFNGDVAALAEGRFGPGLAGAVPVEKRGTRSFSAITTAMLVRFEGWSPAHHNVVFSSDYAAEFESLRQGRVPGQPTVYLCAQDRGEGVDPPPSGAPERAFTIVNAPADGDVHPYTTAESQACAERTIRQLRACGLTVTTEPEAQVITTPSDFATLFPGTGGALYGRSSHGWMASFRRPGSRSQVPGLYLAGGSVHPGAGLPMAILSGRQAARSMLTDFASISPSGRAATGGGISTR